MGEIVKKGKTDLAEVQNLDLLLEDSGHGAEDMTADDLTIPYLSILQSLSPQVKKNDPAYIKGAEEGMFFNSATSKVMDGEKGITIIPVYYVKRYVEWNLREKGGGFVADHGHDASVLENCTPDDRKRSITPAGTQIVPTATYYVIIVDEETGEMDRAIIAMSSTMLKVSRKWNTLTNTVRAKNPTTGEKFMPALWYMSYKATTVPDSNDKGSWMAWKIEYNKPTPELEDGTNLYLAAREFYSSIRGGEVKAAVPQSEEVSIDENEAF